MSWFRVKTSLGESLDRYYLFKLFGFGIFLHRIHGPDPEGIYHNHPWNCVSFILGNYVEYVAEVQWDDGRIVGITTTGYWRKWINFIPAKRYHRVEIIEPVWTILFHLPKSNKWSTINDKGGIAHEPWKGTGSGRSYAAALEAVPVEAVRLDPAFNIRSNPLLNAKAEEVMAMKLKESDWNPPDVKPYTIDIEIKNKDAKEAEERYWREKLANNSIPPHAM